MQNLSAPTVSAAVETAEIALPITGMTCASCVNRIDRFLRKADGVSEVSVNLATESATIRYLPEITGAADLARVISNAGYEVPAAALDLAGRNNEGEREAARGDPVRWRGCGRCGPARGAAPRGCSSASRSLY